MHQAPMCIEFQCTSSIVTTPDIEANDEFVVLTFRPWASPMSLLGRMSGDDCRSRCGVGAMSSSDICATVLFSGDSTPCRPNPCAFNHTV